MDRSRPIILSPDLAELAGGGSEARRERAATALEGALEFVDRQGSELAGLRARIVLKARPAAEGVASIERLQRQDGSFRAPPDRCFPAGPGELGLGDGPLWGTLEALVILAAWRSLHTECVDRAVDFLSTAQQRDGSWCGHDGADAEGCLFATGMIAGFLGRTRSVRPEVLDAAGRYLSSEWAPERVEGGSWSAIAAFALFFTNVHHDLADEALQWCGRELERGYRAGRFDAVATLRALLFCDAEALPGLRIEAEELLDLLLAQQADDGGFWTACLGDDSAEQTRVCATLDAMRGLLVLCGSLADG